jgi:hypothetical protein
MLVALLLAALVAHPALGAASAPPETIRQGRAASAADALALARAELIRGLLALASWANKNELFAQRDSAWRSVIVLDADNIEARRGLRFARDGVGRWKDPPAREVKDRKPALVPEFARRRSELVSAWRGQVLAQLDQEKADAARRATACAEILRIDPEDEVVHGLQGELRVEKAWVLAETVTAEARRAELQQCVQDARQSPPKPEPCTPSAEDKGYLPAWKLAYACEGVRLLLQTSEAEALDMLQAEHAARALVEAVCGKRAAPSPGFSAYVIVEPADCDKFAAAVPDSTDADHRLWRAAPGFGIPHRAAAVLWDKEPRRRLDCFTRHLVASCLFAGYGIDSRQGWILDGLGIYLTHQLTGTRCTWFRPDRPDEDRALRLRLAAEKSNWIVEAQKLVQGGSPPKLADVLKKPLGELTLDDLLVSNAFCAYLVEGLPKALPEILDRIGRGGSAPETIAAVTKRSFPEIEARFVRWLGEYR